MTPPSASGAFVETQPLIERLLKPPEAAIAETTPCAPSLESAASGHHFILSLTRSAEARRSTQTLGPVEPMHAYIHKFEDSGEALSEIRFGAGLGGRRYGASALPFRDASIYWS